MGTRRRDSGEAVKSWLDWISGPAPGSRVVNTQDGGMNPPDCLRGTWSRWDHVTGSKVFSDTPARTSPESDTTTESFGESKRGESPKNTKEQYVSNSPSKQITVPVSVCWETFKAFKLCVGVSSPSRLPTWTTLNDSVRTLPHRVWRPATPLQLVGTEEASWMRWNIFINMYRPTLM